MISHRPLIIAHRGASAEAPENTLPAFRLAWEQRADAIEMDLHLTKDGHVVVAHDADMHRMAGKRRRIAQLTLEELLNIPIPGGPRADAQPTRVPALAEVLREVPMGKRVFLECKAGREMLPALVRTIDETTFPRSLTTIIGFDLGVMAQAARDLPDCEVAWILKPSLLANLTEQIRAARLSGLTALDLRVDWLLTPQTMKLCRNAGLAVYIWTVDDALRAKELADLGVDGLTTNVPGNLRTALGWS